MFTQINPQQRIPALDDNGKYLWDSHAISTYLIEKYGKSDDHSLYPKDLYVRARIDQRLHFESGVLFNVLVQLTRPIRFEGETEFAEKHLQEIHKVFATVETFLEVDPYLVGDQLTVADLSVVTTLTSLSSFVEFSANNYPKIIAWIKRLEALPYFYETNFVGVALQVDLVQRMLAKNKLTFSNKLKKL